jgi:hypothetical protein
MVPIGRYEWRRRPPRLDQGARSRRFTSPQVVFAFTALGTCLALVGGTRAAELAADIPERLTPEQFWQLSSSLSEEDATFISDNLVSNEMSFAQVVPEIVSWGVADGVYLGVGPEQNFTYLAAMKARMAFIIDIRRDNLLLHLLYKAIFTLSPNRATFVSRLFVRPSLGTLAEDVSAGGLMEALERAPVGDASEFEATVQEAIRVLTHGYRLPLTPAEVEQIRSIYRAFHDYGPDITYSSSLLQRQVGLASYTNLMRQRDSAGRELSYLSSEKRYQLVRELEVRNLVVPVVGNFAGPKALREIGGYLRSRNTTVAAFYLSNVEDYLGREPSNPKNGDWKVFCENVAALPTNERSVFIRPLGLAAFDEKGGLMLSEDMHITLRDATVQSAEAEPTLPPALSSILPEMAQCRSGSRAAHRIEHK